MSSKAFSGQHPRRPHILRGGGTGAEIRDTRADVDNALELLESRDATLEYPELDWIDGGVAALGGDVPLKGRFLLQGQTFAELDKDLTHGLKFYPAKPGVDGNDITVELIAGGATGVVYTPATKVLEVTFNAGVDDDDAIATAINANGAQTDGHVRAISSSTINAVAMQAAGGFGPENMTGGDGAGWECRVSGEECLPANVIGVTGTASIAEGLCTVTVPDLTALGDARAAGDPAKVQVTTDGVRTDVTATLA